MAIPYGARAQADYEAPSYKTPPETTSAKSSASSRRFRGAFKAALMIGSIIALFVALSLIRPMPEENVQQSPAQSSLPVAR